MKSKIGEFCQTGKKAFVIGKAPTSIGKLHQGRADYEERIAVWRDKIDALQQRMYAHDRYSMLVVFQAMDAAGKDGTIRAVFSGVNPHGVEVSSFKKPTSNELDQNFLWRTTVAMPSRGRIGIFNRSYYEEVLVCRVHPEIVTDFQQLPSEHTRDLKRLWKNRYETIRNFERYATENGTKVIKFFLNVSRDEQKERFLERLERPEKNWKFSEADVRERGYWDDYQKAYEKCINETATADCPWYTIPADNKKTMRLLVAEAVHDELQKLKTSFPSVSDERRAQLATYAEELRGEG